MTLCPYTRVMLKGGDWEQVEGSQLYFAPWYALSTHLSLLAACHGSLLMPILQVRTLLLRGVNALARSHTAEKLTLPRGHLLPRLPGKGGWAWVGPQDPGRKPEIHTYQLRNRVLQASRGHGQLWFTRHGAGLRCFASQMHAGSSGVSLRLYDHSSKARLGSVPVTMETALGG